MILWWILNKEGALCREKSLHQIFGNVRQGVILTGAWMFRTPIFIA